MHTKIIQPKTELLSPHGRNGPFYVEPGLRPHERSPSPIRPENVEDCECCCLSCCKICAQERCHTDYCSYEVRRPTCTAPRTDSRIPWRQSCTCMASGRCSPPPSLIERNSILRTRSQLETIMNEMSDCCPMRSSFVHPHSPYRHGIWMSPLRFHYLYKPAYRQQIVETKDVAKPKRFQCIYCEKSFGKSSHLRDHVRTHTGERPFRCTWCNKAFTQYSNLRTHMRIHTGEKPYSCKYCLKSFTQAVTLRSHLRTHSNEEELASPN